MKCSGVLNELSAYIDGETPRAEEIRRHLQRCPGCARRHMELSKLSSHLQNLAPAQAPHGFAARTVCEAKERGLVRAPWPCRPAHAAVAAVLLVAVVLGWTTLRTEPHGYKTAGPRSEIAHRPGVLPERSAQELRQAIIQRLAADDFDPSDLEACGNPAGPDWLYEDSVFAAGIVPGAWLDELEMELDDRGDWYTVLEELDSEETKALEVILSEQMEERWS